MTITNKEKGFLEQVPEPNVTAKPSVTYADMLLFKLFVNACSESENIAKESSGVPKFFWAKPSFVENFAGTATDFAYSIGNIAENLGQGISTGKSGLYYAAFKSSAGVQCRASWNRYQHLPQKQEAAKPSGFEASSKEAKFPGPAHNLAYVHYNCNEKEEEHARYLEKATFRLKGMIPIKTSLYLNCLHFGVEND